MSRSLIPRLVLLAALATMPLSPWAAPAPAAAMQTVCTITVNSPDEKEALRRHLPESKYRFVELVERGRPDWLASSCRAGISCDVLVISGHYDGGNEFFSDQLEVQEHLPVDELERVSCSGSCPGLFSRLKEVYLFGCNTLNPQPQSSASSDIVRSLVREGLAPKQAQRELLSLAAAHGESSRDRMRQIFKGVPVIYGFSSTAPLGPIAASTLERYLRGSGDREIARGHPSGRLLGYFAPFSMAATQGMTDEDPHLQARHDMCQFADDRRPPAEKLGFVHQLLQRHTAEARLYIDRIRRLTSLLDERARQQPAVARELAAIAGDAAARERFLEDARVAEPPTARIRLLDVARDLGWLTEDRRWEELALMLGELLSRREVGVPEIGLACSLNAQGDLDGAFNRRVVPGSVADDVPHAAVRACLGSAEGRARLLQALQSVDESDVAMAQAYLRHRPITDAAELRSVVAGIAGMAPGDAQVRALESLGRHYLSDSEALDMLTDLFAMTPSWEVQNAIAGVLIRADRHALGRTRLLLTLLEKRRSPADGSSMVDALILRLQTP